MDTMSEKRPVASEIPLESVTSHTVEKAEHADLCDDAKLTTVVTESDDEAHNKLLPNGEKSADPNDKTSMNSKLEKEFIDQDVTIDFEMRQPLIYRVNESPPPYLLFLFALQQSLLCIGSPLGITVIVSEVICSQKDDFIKTEILSASFLMAGLSTIMMSTIGVRLPVFQGPASTYLIPLIAMSSLPEWQCPETFKSVNPVDNTTVWMTTVGNGTVVTMREVILTKLSQLSGSLMLAGAIHFLIGATGLVGILIRYIGPVTIVPTIVLVGLYIYKLLVKFSETSWLVSSLSTFCCLLLSLYLSNRKTPIPMWSRSKGFHIFWYPLHQVFSVLFGMIFGWLLSLILTKSGYFTDDENNTGYLARTDARSYIIEQSDWFIFPYPGKFGSFSFSTGGFISFFMATLMSVLDSIGDYNATARIVRVPPPPKYAFNRGIAVEGLMSVLSGSMGCCHATVSYGSSMGVMSITRVVSRRVFQVCGLLFIICAVFGKVGGVLITIPYSVLGGTSFVAIGLFIGLVLSYLQTVDLNSTRNLAIIGNSLLLGLMLPYWVKENPEAINTGNTDADNAITVLLSNPSFVGGFLACFLDNTVPGTLKERGLLDQMKDLDDKEAKKLAESYADGLEVYRLPFIPECFRRTKIARYLPFFEKYEE